MRRLLRLDAVSKAQKLIATGMSQARELGINISAIVNDELWRTMQSATGLPFASFPEFATAPQPNGLGICTQEAMDELGVVLHKCGLYGIWEELLRATTRDRGRPPKNRAAGENIPRFKLPTSHTARAKQVILLAKHHPVIFGELVDGSLSLRAAVRAAGLASAHSRRNLRFNVFDRERALELGPAAKRRLLREAFTAMGLEAQCHLLANIVGPATGFPELASRWRAYTIRNSRPEDDPAHHPTP